MKLSNLNLFSIQLYLKSKLGTWNLELGTWNLELGTWNLELGTWNLELGTWNLELGTKLFKNYQLTNQASLT